MRTVSFSRTAGLGLVGLLLVTGSSLACTGLIGVDDVYFQADGGPNANDAPNGAATASDANHPAPSSDAGTHVDASADGPSVDEPDTPAGDASECQSRLSSVLFLDGAKGEFIHPRSEGKAWYYGGIAEGFKMELSPAHDSIKFTVASDDYAWHADMSTAKLSKPLAVGTFSKAERFGSEPVGSPGLAVGGNGRECSVVAGTFWISEILWNAGELTHLVAAFEQRCDGSPVVLRGCVKFVR